MFPATRWTKTKPFATHLVAQGLLTSWQVNNLLNGKYKGFLLGDLKILNVLRSCALTRVYLAEDQRLQRRVAVKVLRPRHNSDSQELERFFRSIRALARMAHPNILKVLGTQVESGVNSAVIEQFDGESLETLVAKSGPLDVCSAIRLFAQMVGAVQHSHDGGVILRALSPATIFVDGAGRLKLDSFDWARVNDGPLIASMEPLAQFAVENADFLAPESVLASVDVDETADIYSLGCVLYFMLGGRPPFAGSITDVLCAHQQLQPPPLSELRRGLPPKITKLCDAMMTKLPMMRPRASSIAWEVAGWVTRN